MDTQTMSGLASLIRGLQQGYEGAQAGNRSDEEFKLKQRVQAAQMANMDQDNQLKRLQLEQQAPLIDAQKGYYLGRNNQVDPSVANPVLSQAGIPNVTGPLDQSTFGTIAGMVNNRNSNATREAIGRNTKGNSPSDALKEWSKTKNDYEKGLIDYDKTILANTSKLNIMQDETDKKRIMDEIENAKAGKDILKFKLQNHLKIGRENNVNPMLLASSADSDYADYKAKQDADKLAAENLARTQGTPMPTTQTAQPSQAPFNLMDLVAKLLTKKTPLQ